LDRLTQITNRDSADFSQSFTYDAADNVTSNSAVGSYSYPAPTGPRPHAVTQAGNQSYTYDARGNMTAGGGRTMTYDGLDRPVSVTRAGTTTTFTYGPDGARLKKVSGGQTTLYLGADEEITPEGRKIRHPHAGVREVDGTLNWLQSDHLASIRLMTDGSGAVIAENHYRPYGQRSELQQAANLPRESKGWIGERDDPETGLTYLNARYYDPILARFVSPDWFDPTKQGVGTNRYAYAGNNPVAFKDPSGNSTYVEQDEENKGEYFVRQVMRDDDLGIYVIGGDLEDRWEKIGETRFWDSFVSPETGRAVGKIYKDKEIDKYYDNLVEQASGESSFTVAWKSLPGGEYDLKSTFPGHEGRSYHGFLLDGTYTSLREAGNILAGQNAAMQGIAFKDYQQMAGRLHASDSLLSAGWNQVSGNVMGPPPNYGENDYQRTRSEYGYLKGYIQQNRIRDFLP
ncbi:RHS repeat domain-containing protein, partial [Pannonibacter tanglangensis]